MVIYTTEKWPACTQDACGVDTFGPYHGQNCARARFAAEWLEAWKDTPGAFRSQAIEEET